MRKIGKDGKDVGVVGGGSAVNFGHPPARCARVPLRFAKGGVGGGWFAYLGELLAYTPVNVLDSLGLLGRGFRPGT